jgi:hypothetical protein
MLYVCVVKFDVIENLKIFLIFEATKQDLSEMLTRTRCKKKCASDALLPGFQVKTAVVLKPCLVYPKNLKVFKILRHIESCGTCMKH